ncbi:flagellar basal-body rod modification protein FlgD [Povalibacter uvarum]|uniref:Basal-body rod modification protein FlgD n=1 Tax=Povalibacter uvarum TaxID=732238 RepID=A0A841HEA5_9GAMM|nr:flagellar hook capping FlgD N-terminal domain-containing protein [Povalibacter uvarum]MBB6091177.1 flagellar basal-body rod modification protein FlgD [Povalibacter uvarum]
MAITPTEAANLTAAAQSLRLDDLLRVLLTELTHQNPFKPMDNKDFMGQIAQFAALDSSQRLNESIDQLLTLQAMNQSVGLINRTVTLRLDDGRLVTGRVQRLTLAEGLPRLTVQDAQTSEVYPNVALGQIESVT